MADLALSAAQVIFAALDNTTLKEVCNLRGYRSRIEELKDTVSTIQKVLLGADAKRELSPEEQDYVEKLKDAVYDADDLFDEILTRDQLKQHNSKLPDKVRDFFSSENPLAVAVKCSKQVKKIKKRLETVADNSNKFGFKFDSEPIRRRREDTCHYVYKPDIVGRDNDVKRVRERLLGSDSKENVEFLTIVGVGGLGKTTVAQLVYDDENIKQEFPLRLWVCVSDQDGQDFSVKDILLKVLDIVGHKLDDSSSTERAFGVFEETLGGKKCLLVLDDIWNENRRRWSDLRKFLMVFGKGSRILATTRSELAARVIGDGDTRTYGLEGLSHEDSWDLFKLTAFGDGPEQEMARHDDLVEIGKKILKKCSNVPLAIKVVGSLLFGQETSKWRAFQENGLRNISPGDDGVISILKLSYDNLEPSLKSCFSYCAVFPKDFVIQRDMLVSLWMAQGFIKPFYDQSIEDAGEDHFLILLRRCFFQDVKTDGFGDIVSCKIHDLMHDVAQKVAGREICVASCLRSNPDYQKARHVFEDEKIFEDNIFVKSKIRSYLQDGYYTSNHFAIKLEPIIAYWGCLRSLSINNVLIEELPTTIGKLLHLRYLDLCWCRKLKKLPNTITNLHNLQTLLLRGCESLEELPKDLSKLVSLRALDIFGCGGLSYMPAGIGKLTRLSILNMFCVANEGSCGQLKELKAFVNFRGYLSIKIPREYTQVEEIEGESGYLVDMEHLKSVSVYFGYEEDHDEERVKRDETLLSKLQPPANLRGFQMWEYTGRRIPRWLGDNWASFFPLLVSVQLFNCTRLQHLPVLSQLEHLRTLQLSHMKDLVYVEEDIRSDGRASSSRSVKFFPSLERLTLCLLPKVKGWWGRRGVELAAEDVMADSCQPSSFPRLSDLKISECPDLISLPLCPTVETLTLRGVNKRLRLIASPISVREVEIRHVTDLEALPSCRLTRLSIINTEVVNFSGTGEVFHTLGFCLQHLAIGGCYNLTSLRGGGFQHLTALKSLAIFLCPQLRLNEEDDGEGLPWRSLHNSLHSLDLGSSHVEDLILPRGVQCLSDLQHLSISYNQHLEANLQRINCLSSLKSLNITNPRSLKSIPEAMRSLTSLRRLLIASSSEELKERCKDPDGEDYPKIQHIPDIQFY